MISQKLQTAFNLIETAVFPRWQKASPEEKEKITKELGETQAKMIIAEIEENLVRQLKGVK